MPSTRKAPRCVFFFCSLLGIGLLAGCSSMKSAPPVHVDEQEWTSPHGGSGVQLLTEHYDLRVTSSDALLRSYLGPFMEASFKAYTKTIRPNRQPSDQMVVYLFGTREEWAGFTRRAFPAQAEVYLHIHAGGYVDTPTAISVIHDLGRDRTLSLMAHEGFHQYVDRYLDRPLPAWLNEGLACQFEAFSLRDAEPKFTPKANLLRRGSLREALAAPNGLIPLSDLLRMNAGEAVIETGQQVRSYYAQVWSLILFLQLGADGQYAKPFANLLAEAGTERMSAAIGAYRAATPGSEHLSQGEIVFRHYISEDLTTCMNQYIEFARHLVY
jgi:hypothetical protein